MHRRMWTIVLLSLQGFACAGGTPSTAPVAPKAADAPDRANSTARAILDRLEKAGETYAMLRADVDYATESRMTGEKEERTGWVAYQKETADQPAKFRVCFETLRLDEGPKRSEKVDYIYDGESLMIDKYKIKSRTQFSGMKDALKSNKAPIPMLFGRKTQEVLESLEAETRDPEVGDPEGADYLKLTPRPGREKDVGFVRLEMWVDRKLNLPVRIRTRDENKNVTTAVFQNIQPKAKADPKLFDVPKPSGFELIVEPLK